MEIIWKPFMVIVGSDPYLRDETHRNDNLRHLLNQEVQIRILTDIHLMMPEILRTQLRDVPDEHQETHLGNFKNS